MQCKRQEQATQSTIVELKSVVGNLLHDPSVCFVISQIKIFSASAGTKEEQDFEVFHCPINTVTRILGGAMLVRCTVNPVTVQARICLPTEFDRIADVLSTQKEVREM